CGTSTRRYSLMRNAGSLIVGSLTTGTRWADGLTPPAGSAATDTRIWHNGKAHGPLHRCRSTGCQVWMEAVSRIALEVQGDVKRRDQVIFELPWSRMHDPRNQSVRRHPRRQVLFTEYE